MGLSADEYAPGRIVRYDGDNVVIHDQVVSATGGRYLIVSPPGRDFYGLMAEGTLRDDQDDRAEAVNDDEAREIREQALTDQQARTEPEPEPDPVTPGGTLPENPPVTGTDANATPEPGTATGTDGPDGTAPDTAAPDTPADAPTTTPAPTEQGGTTPNQ